MLEQYGAVKNPTLQIQNVLNTETKLQNIYNQLNDRLLAVSNIYAQLNDQLLAVSNIYAINSMTGYSL